MKYKINNFSSPALSGSDDKGMFSARCYEAPRDSFVIAPQN